MSTKKNKRAHASFTRAKHVAIRKIRAWLNIPGGSTTSTHDVIIDQFIAAGFESSAPAERKKRHKWLVELYESKGHACFGVAVPRKKRSDAVKEFYNVKGIGGIYKILCIPTGEFYIGSSSNMQARWMSHLFELMINCHCNGRLQKAYDAYGENSFAFIVIKSSKGESRLDLYKLEQHYIDTLNPQLNIERQVKIPPGLLQQLSAGHREMGQPKLQV